VAARLTDQQRAAQHHDGGHDDPGRLGHQVDQVARGQKLGVTGLEVDDDGDQAEQDGQGAAVAAADPGPPDLDVLAEGVGEYLRSGDRSDRGRDTVGFSWRLLDVTARWRSLTMARARRRKVVSR